MNLREGVVVGIGAAAGSIVRYILTLIFGTGMVVVLLINIAGCFLFGVTKPAAWWSVGFLGGFSTYATAIVLSYRGVDLVYLTVTVVLCLSGWALGDFIRHHPHHPDSPTATTDNDSADTDRTDALERFGIGDDDGTVPGGEQQ